MEYTILTINPGSTSTKIAIYTNEKEAFVLNITHSNEEIAKYPNIMDQLDFRKEVIINTLQNNGFHLENIDIVVSRGGLVRPIPSGVYEVNEQMIEDLYNSKRGVHASNLGAIIGKEIASLTEREIKAFIADPVVVDELQDVARVAGHPDFERYSIFHALNQKAVARAYAKEIGKDYSELNLIVAHMGGGVSVGAHRKGFVVDVNNALDGEGPFSPERSGTLPTGQLVDMCFSGKSKAEVKKMLMGGGGMVAYTGTNDARVVQDKALTDPYNNFIQEAFCYQVSKEIGAMAVVLEGKVDAILLTGGIAYGKIITDTIARHTSFIAPISVHPGEDEMRALAVNGLMVLRGELTPKEY